MDKDCFLSVVLIIFFPAALCVFLFTNSFQSLSILLACDSCDSPASAFQVVANMVECAMLNSHVFYFMGGLILMLLHLFTPRCLMFNVCFCSTFSLCGEAVLTDIQSQLAWNLLSPCLSFLSEEFTECAITHDWVNFC